MTMNFSETQKFSKDLKRLSKKYRSLPEDLDEFKKVVSALPCGSSKHFAILHEKGDLKIIKARMFCRYLKGSSLRIVYAYDSRSKCITCIELFYKGERERETFARIDQFLEIIEE